jgi:hypothetical protein
MSALGALRLFAQELNVSMLRSQLEGGLLQAAALASRCYASLQTV